MSDEIKSTLFSQLSYINNFIRTLEDFSKLYSVDLSNDKSYVIAKSQRKMLKDIINSN